MPGYIPVEMQGRANASAQGHQIQSTIDQLEQRLRNMQWNGAPPIEMQNIEAEIQKLRRQQQTDLVTKQYELQKQGNRQTLPGIGNAQNPQGGQRRTEAAMLSNYLSTLFGINSGGGQGGGNPSRGY